MSDVWGKNFKITLFGESHGTAIGVVIDGLPAGIALDLLEIDREMKRRAPGKNKLSTPRSEADTVEIVSGYFEDRTTGSALCGIIRNTNTQSKDYTQFKRLMRPGQADYPAWVKYQGFNDVRGSGHFSGRITAGLVFAGAIAKQILKRKDITVGSHIESVYNIKDERFDFEKVDSTLLDCLNHQDMPLLNKGLANAIEETIMKAKEEGDSIGGVIEVAVVGLQAGIGQPFFDSIESVLSSLLFSVPSVKGVEFGSGFEVSKMKGSQVNDAYYYDQMGQVRTKTNHNGGITGGISNGSPILFRCAIKPPASISKKQSTIDVEIKKNAEVEVHGRHDPIIVIRALPVIEAVTAIGLLDLMLGDLGHGFTQEG